MTDTIYKKNYEALLFSNGLLGNLSEKCFPFIEKDNYIRIISCSTS